MIFVLNNFLKNYFHVLFIISYVFLSNYIFDEDLESYFLNIQEYNQDITTQKYFWYKYLFFPLRFFFEDPITLIKFYQTLLLLSFILFIDKLLIKGNYIFRIFLILIFLFVPFITDFYSQYLRESTALIFFLFGTRLKQLKYNIPLYILAFLCHYISFFWIATYYITLFFIKNIDSNRFIIFIYLLLFIISLAFCCFQYFDLFNLKILLPENISNYLVGNRTNLNGIIYLIFYITYLMLMFFNFRTPFYSISILLLFVNLIFYQNIVDYGRAFQAPAIFHFISSLLLFLKNRFLFDLIICVLLSLVFYLI